MAVSKTFQVDLVTPFRTVYSNRVVYLEVMAWDGYLGVLANHAPLLEQLGVGELLLREPDGKEWVFAIGGGFMEVNPERTIVLADSAERPEEIDLERARAALARAEARRAGELDQDNLDALRAEIALKRAINRIRVRESHLSLGR